MNDSPLTRSAALPVLPSGEAAAGAAPPGTPGTPGAAPVTSVRTRPLADSPLLQTRAAELLRTPSMLGDFNDVELQHVVAYLRLATFPAGSTIFREGDHSNTGYMLLTLSGEVNVDAAPFDSDEDRVDISVLGPGNILGELGLIDGAPRSTTCTAVTEVTVAVLSRKAFDLLLVEHPASAAKLMVGLAKRIADRLRAMSEQMGLYVKIAREAREEVARLSRR